MSNKFNNAAQEIGDFGSKGCRLVLWYLCDHANENGVSYAGYEKIMARCEIGSRDTLDEVLAYLSELKILHKQKRWRQCNKYFLNLERIKELAGVDVSKKWGGGARAEREAARAQKQDELPVSKEAATILEALGGGVPELTDGNPASLHNTLSGLHSTLNGKVEVRSTVVEVRSVGDIPSVVPSENNPPVCFPSVSKQEGGTKSLKAKSKTTAAPTPPQVQNIPSPVPRASAASIPRGPAPCADRAERCKHQRRKIACHECLQEEDDQLEG